MRSALLLGRWTDAASTAAQALATVVAAEAVSAEGATLCISAATLALKHGRAAASAAGAAVTPPPGLTRSLCLALARGAAAGDPRPLLLRAAARLVPALRPLPPADARALARAACGAVVSAAPAASSSSPRHPAWDVTATSADIAADLLAAAPDNSDDVPIPWLLRAELGRVVAALLPAAADGAGSGARRRRARAVALAFSGAVPGVARAPAAAVVPAVDALHAALARARCCRANAFLRRAVVAVTRADVRAALADEKRQVRCSRRSYASLLVSGASPR